MFLDIEVKHDNGWVAASIESKHIDEVVSALHDTGISVACISDLTLFNWKRQLQGGVCTVTNRIGKFSLIVTSSTINPDVTVFVHKYGSGAAAVTIQDDGSVYVWWKAGNNINVLVEGWVCKTVNRTPSIVYEAQDVNQSDVLYSCEAVFIRNEYKENNNVKG